jgi:predicted NBD/HSP70 family sugar kinase
LVAISGDQGFLKQLNRAALLRLLRRHPDSSRAELAQYSGLTKVTVGALVAELLEEGWIREGDKVQNGAGRPSRPLRINPNYLTLLGAEIGVDYLSVLACDLEGNVLAHTSHPYTPIPPEDTARKLIEMLMALLQSPTLEGRYVIGLGVGAPGPVENGVLHIAPNLGWRDVALVDLLQLEWKAQVSEALTQIPPKRSRKRTLPKGTLVLGDALLPPLEQFPILLENEANAAAMSEYIFGDVTQGSSQGSLLYLSLGVGVGCGIIIGDQILRGEGGYAGEVGHTTLLENGPPCTCGNHGCAETLLNQRRLSEQLGAPQGRLYTMNEILERVQAGQGEKALRELAYHLGILLANMVNVFSPSALVIGGNLTRLGDLLLEPALVELERRSFLRKHARVYLCGRGVDASAVGAAAVVLHHVLSPAQG